MNINWKQALSTPETSIEEVIKIIDQASLRVALIVDDKMTLLGVVTDGDIRRGLLKHIALSEPVSRVMNRNPKTATIEMNKEEIIEKMKENQLIHIPIVDSSNKLVNLEIFQNITQTIQYNNYIFLIAGGFGMRLRPLTNDIPKPLLKIGKNPVIEKIIDDCKNNGFCKFFISVHYKSNMFKEYFGNGDNKEIEINYIEEKEPLGTGGCLSLLPKNITEPIIVMNADLITNIDFSHLLDYHYNMGSDVVMCVREYDFQVPYGTVNSKNYCVKSITEKPVHKFFVNAGIYVFSPKILKNIPKNKYLLMTDLINDLVKDGYKVNMFPIHEYWLDIGRHADYKKAQIEEN